MFGGAKFLGLFLILALNSGSSSAQDPNLAANRLFVQAQKLLQEPAPPGKEEALARLKQVKELAARIVDDHPASNLAVQLSSGQAIGTFSLKTVEAEISKATVALHTENAHRDAARCAAAPAMACLLVQAMAAAYQAEDTLDRANSLSGVAKLQAKLGDRNGAIETLGHAKQAALAETREGYKTFVAANIIDAEMTLDLVTEATRTATTFRGEAGMADIASALAKKGRRDEAMRMTERVRDPVARMSTYISIADFDVAAGRRDLVTEPLSRARRIADAIADIGSKSFWLSRVGLAEGKAGISTASQTFDAAELTARTEPKEFMRSQRLSNIAQNRAAVGQYKKALDLANSITNDYPKAEALVAIAKHGEALTQMGPDLLRAAVDAAKAVTIASFKASALSEATEAQANAGLMSEAMQTAMSIKENSYRSRAIGYIAKAKANAGQLAEARDLAVKIEDDTYHAIAVGVVAKLYAEKGDIRQGYELAQTIRRPLWKVRTLVSLSGES